MLSAWTGSLVVTVKSIKIITNRFLGLWRRQRGGMKGSLSQKHFECGRFKVFHCKTSPCCLQGQESSNISVGQDRFHASKSEVQEEEARVTWKASLYNKTRALRQLCLSAVLWFGFSIPWSNTWMRQAAAGICLLKCFCLCFCCTFRAKPEPRIPCEKQHSRVTDH